MPSFYREAINDLQSNIEVFKLENPKLFYDQLVLSKSLTLKTQMKRIEAQQLDDDEVNAIFPNMHKGKYVSPTQKQILYRILFGITPTSEGLAKRHKRVFHCKVCFMEQETEEHIFYFCPFVQQIKLDLIKLLRQPHNTLFNVFKAIFFNILPQQFNGEYLEVKQLLIHIYRETIWKIRNLATHKNQSFNKDTIRKIFIAKIKWQRFFMPENAFFGELTNEYK